jgi:putative ABC transport system permease protein
MPILEALRFAFASLRSAKLRTFLTVLGILIGVASVIAVVAITQGLDQYVSAQVLELGSKSFTVSKMPAIITSHEMWEEMRKRKDITVTDLDVVREACEACSEVGGSSQANRTAKYRDIKQEDVTVFGITENYSRIGSIRELTVGRHLIPDDVDRARPVAVIGMDLVDALFKEVEPLGKIILVGGQPVTVVGVATRKGSVFGFSQDNFVWVPLTTFRKLFGTQRSITIHVEARSMAVFERAQDQCRMALRARRHLGFKKPDDFNVETGESILDLWQTFTRNIYIVTFVVTAISLIVGGIVVMNIMLVSVTERIREIGVRKALGARRSDIRWQFLIEAMILSALGGILGVVGAAIFSWVLALVLGKIMSADFSAPVRLWAVLMALVVSAGVGLVSGLYPAARAAALDPVVALRNE